MHDVSMKDRWSVLLNVRKNVRLTFYFDIEVRIRFGFLHVLFILLVFKAFQTMETLLEQQRRYHEERERLMDATVKEMLQPSKAVMANFSIYTCRLLYIVTKLQKSLWFGLNNVFII